MRVAIIAEGRGDLAVLTNLLKGWLGLDREDVQYLRPEYSLDETDLHAMREEQRSNWGLVKKECEGGEKLSEFLDSQIAGERLVVIHIDTAEAELAGYDVKRPTLDDENERVGVFRDCVIAKIQKWLGGGYTDRVRYAIAVEEMDAWVLAIWAPKSLTDTGLYRNAKERLDKELNRPNQLSEKKRKQLYQLEIFDRYDELTRKFRKKRELELSAKRNVSLRLFLDSLPSGPDL